MNCRIVVKYCLFPGINLHSRLRYTRLPEHFESGAITKPRIVLDAGSGNGMLGYQSYRTGNSVVGISVKGSEVVGSRKFFNEYLGIPRERLRFEEANLYDLNYPDEQFDEIICAEVLEHLRRDSDVCRSFWRMLKPGGVLHICAPNAEHPYNKNFPLDHEENGGHVRAGYTEDSYRGLLEPLGFEVEQIMGLGGPIRQAFNRWIKEIQSRYGVGAGLPLFLLALLILPFERRDVNPSMPFSIYAKVRKPLEKR